MRNCDVLSDADVSADSDLPSRDGGDDERGFCAVCDALPSNGGVRPAYDSFGLDACVLMPFSFLSFSSVDSQRRGAD